MAKPLRIFFFSDWRIARLDLAEAMLDAVSPVDLILYGGDDVARFAPLDVPQRIFDKLRERCCASLEHALRHRAGSRIIEQIRTLALFHDDIWWDEPQALIEYAARLLKKKPRYAPFLTQGRWTIDRVLRLFDQPASDNWLHRIAHRATHGVGAVIGNDCFPEDRYVLQTDRVTDVHESPILANGWGIIGIEGAIVSRGRTGDAEVNNIGYVLHQDAAVKAHLTGRLEQLGIPGDRTIVLSHTPPRGALDIGIRFGFDQLGSPALASFVRRHKVPLALCGHVHSHGGRIARLGETLVVNAACDDTKEKRVYAAVIDLAPGEPPRLTWCDPTPHSVLYVPGIGPTLADRLASRGIRRPEQLLSAGEALLRKAGCGETRLKRLAAYRRAITERTHVWLRKRPLPLPAQFLFFDVETGLTQSTGETTVGQAKVSKPWMIAAAVETDERVQQWVAPRRAEQRAMLRDFLEFVRAYPNTVICSWSGTRFDERSLEAGLRSAYVKGWSVWRTRTKLDLLPLLRRNLVFPAHDWSVASIAAYCGVPPDPDDTLDGFMVGLLYERFRRWGDSLPVRHIRRRNANDVARLAHIATWLREQNRVLEAQRDAERVAGSTPAPGWGRGFVKGVLRAYLRGRGDQRWVQACMTRSGVPPAEIRRMADDLRTQTPTYRWQELSHFLSG